MLANFFLSRIFFQRHIMQDFLFPPYNSFSFLAFQVSSSGFLSGEIFLLIAQPPSLSRKCHGV